MVESFQRDGKLVFVFEGRLDSLACAKMSDEIMTKVQEANLPVVFDFKSTDYVTSAFIRICMSIFKTIGKENLKCIHMNDAVKEVFKLSHVDHYIQMDSDMDSFIMS